MERILHFDDDDLEASLRLTVQERLRQANAAFRLYHELHRPYANPFHRGFDSIEELEEFEKEHGLPR